MLVPPELRIAALPLPDLPDPKDPRVSVWRDLDGRICALGEQLGGTARFHALGVATFEFDREGPVVVARPTELATSANVVDQFYRTALPLILHFRGFEVLHASGVKTPSGIVAFCATKESGKSTIACALEARGFRLWADDAIVFEIDERAIETVKVPFQMRLRPLSAAHFGREATSGQRFDAPLDWRFERKALVAAVILRRLSGPSAIALKRLEPGAGLAAMLTHSYSFSLVDDDRKRAMMTRYLALVGRLPIYELSYPSGLEHLTGIVELLEETIAASSQDHRA